MVSEASALYSPGYLDESIGSELVAFASVCIALNIFVVGLRFAARYVSRAPVGADDYLTIPALVFLVADGAVTIALAQYGGAGHHLAALIMRHPSKLATFAKLELSLTVVYLCGAMFPKLSILCLFLRIFTKPWDRRACYVIMIVVIATAIAGLIATFTQCVPLEIIWDPTIRGGHCVNRNAAWAWGTFPNIVTDVAMLLLPIPMIWKLQLSWKDKLGVLLTFVAGGLLITSILRFHGFLTTDGASPTADGTWTVVKLAMYSLAELEVYLIASCLPIYRSLYLSIRRRKTQPTQNTTRGPDKYFSQSKKGEKDTQLAPYPGVHRQGYGIIAEENESPPKR